MAEGGALLPFQHFVASSKLHELQGQSGVLVLGLMGAGKSTTIAVQQGAILEQDRYGQYKVVASSVYTPKVSDGVTSQTFNIGVFSDTESNLLYFDTAGLDENRGIYEASWTRFSLAFALSVLDNISCTLVVVDYMSLWSSRGQGFEELAVSLSKVVGFSKTSTHFYRSMAFVITRGQFGSSKITLERLRQTLLRMKEEKMVRGKDKLFVLSCRFPQTSVRSAVTADPQTSWERLMLPVTGIDWRTVPKDDATLRDLNRLRSVLELLDAMEEAFLHERVFLSFPENTQACEAQRRGVNTIIARSPKISKTQLTEIAKSRSSSALEVLNILAAAAGAATPEVSRLATLRKSLLDAVERKSTILQGIAADWRKVRQRMEEAKQLELDSVKTKIAAAKRQAEVHRRSQEKVVFKKEEVRRVKDGNVLLWLLGAEQVHCGFRYNLGNVDPEAWYMDFDVKGEHFDKENQREEGPPGRRTGLSMDLKSDKGYDLIVDVYLYRQEKDMPSTRDRVQQLVTDVETLETTKWQLDAELTALSVLQNEDDLSVYVMNAETQMLAEIRSTEEQLQQRLEDFEERYSARTSAGVCPPAPPTRYQAVQNLYNILRVLRYDDLAPGPRNSIAEFLASFNLLLQQKATTDRCRVSQIVLGQHRGAPDQGEAMDYSEGVPPIHRPYSPSAVVTGIDTALASSRQVWQQTSDRLLQYLGGLALQSRQLVRDEPGAFGVAILAVLFAPLPTFVGRLHAGFAGFLLAMQFNMYVSRVAGGSETVLRAIRQELREAAAGANDQLRAGLAEAAGRVDERLRGPPTQEAASSTFDKVVLGLRALRRIFF